MKKTALWVVGFGAVGVVAFLALKGRGRSGGGVNVTVSAPSGGTLPPGPKPATNKFDAVETGVETIGSFLGVLASRGTFDPAPAKPAKPTAMDEIKKAESSTAKLS